MPIWAPGKHLRKVIVRVSAPTTSTYAATSLLLQLIGAMIANRTGTRALDPQIIASIVTAIGPSHNCGDLGATYRGHLWCNLILRSSLHRTSFGAVAPCIYVVLIAAWFAWVTSLLLLVILMVVLLVLHDFLAAWPSTAMGFIACATWVGLLHC